MFEAILYPFDRIHPGQLLSQYSDWVYFTLILIFFISVAGITLRKHFDRPYVKPLIISVGLILTVGVFMAKRYLVMIFEGWGVLGLILLVFMVSTIPYGLCRGFGMAGIKAFYLTYILIYIIAWFKFPIFFYSLSDHNLGLVNLGLLIVFFVAVFKFIPLGRSKKIDAGQLVDNSTFIPEIEQNIRTQNAEKNLVKNKAVKLTKHEIKTIEDMAEALAEIQLIVEKNKATLSREERTEIASILQKLSNKEQIFKTVLLNLQKIFQKIGSIDTKQLQNLKDRVAKASEKERQILKSEIDRKEIKLKIEKEVLKFENRLEHYINLFNEYINYAVNQIRGSPYPNDAKPYFQKARGVLTNISGMLKDIGVLEKKIIETIKIERELLKKERKTA